jgi:endonuclease IV
VKAKNIKNPYEVLSKNSTLVKEDDEQVYSQICNFRRLILDIERTLNLSEAVSVEQQHIEKENSLLSKLIAVLKSIQVHVDVCHHFNHDYKISTPNCITIIIITFTH